jgi:tetratricopeptide (TPR) repeat protein
MEEAEVKELLEKVPGAVMIQAEPGSKLFMQTVRHQFRTEQRFATVSRLLEVSSDEIDRTVAADSLGYFGRRATPFLIRALENDTPTVRRHAAAALGLTGDPAAEPALRSALADPEPNVRFAAAQSIDLLPILSQVSSPDLVDLTEFQKELEPEPAKPGEKPKTSVSMDLEAQNLFQELERRAHAHQSVGRFREAAQCFGEIIAMTPGLASAYVGRGTALQQDEQYEAALADLNRALELDPKNADAYRRRGICHRRLEMWEETLQDAIKAVELAPENAQNWYNLGFLRQRNKEDQAAREAYDRAIQLRPDYAVALMARGSLRLAQDDAAGAVDDLSAGLTLSPTTAGGWWNRSIAHKMLGNEEAMKEDQRRAIELAPALAEQLAEDAP